MKSAFADTGQLEGRGMRAMIKPSKAAEGGLIRTVKKTAIAPRKTQSAPVRKTIRYTSLQSRFGDRGIERGKYNNSGKKRKKKKNCRGGPRNWKKNGAVIRKDR